MTHKFTKVLFALEYQGKAYGVRLPAKQMEKWLAEVASQSASGTLDLHLMPNQELFAVAVQPAPCVSTVPFGWVANSPEGYEPVEAFTRNKDIAEKYRAAGWSVTEVFTNSPISAKS
ncbi:hypothetical protein ACK249_003621 [Pseudomonas aeruginosa]|uniref:hypothetical protein n=1 Tax=Pseudomonas aeruginosa TaxID=287 RepID=UPI0025C8A6B1|nr:hypothetical protein [Pseudomonas aeruginosa]